MKTLESYLNKSEQFHVGIMIWSIFLLSPEEDAISIQSFAENACGEEGSKKFSVLEIKRGTEVAEIGRFFEAL